MRLVEIFRAVRRLLTADGTLWLNIGDSYCRHPAKGQHKPGDKRKQGYIYERGDGKASSSFDLKGSGLKEKDLIGVPWRLTLALQQPWLSWPDCGRESHGSAYPALLDGRRLCPACLTVNEPDVTEEGGYPRSDAIWHKPNALSNSVKNRSNTAHEYVFLFAKSSSYYRDYEAIEEPAVDGERGREGRSGRSTPPPTRARTSPSCHRP
jgi:DNA methylase